ncbi:nuclear receptor ROR-alpha A-like [Tigriopus californicus]|uniref:nuclear receptor ROR-alpha A-like n=1 Tax=Tigriopus californicus TaxID=6832 RepID=UPI0027D9CF4B|nr:nuclear receptor ROR-alpha A-like [Tigriopus californicus]XP_059087541.1 nuclear receptor ROR-alpha A-like [Tigriopus californicus]|eukprot:TCALIF_03125-PA protein Name:"Similar to nhr-35 Nuclear hormone receptor family member nhr-35 (Caenorhabditis elegans)" AED:0.26 eAED:0.84 QI:0/-1/0/1/-1/1/1/0/558
MMLADGQFGFWNSKVDLAHAGCSSSSALASMMTSNPSGPEHSVGKPGKPKRKRPKFIRKVVCKVCGDVANDHIHYGAIACYSCRAFFRRGVNANAPYYCSQSKTCPITKHTRKHCQYCRFQKCMAIGMRASWVMTEEDKQEKKEKARLKRVSKVGKDSGSLSESGMVTEFDDHGPMGDESSPFGGNHFSTDSQPVSHQSQVYCHEDQYLSSEDPQMSYCSGSRDSLHSPTPSSAFSEYPTASHTPPFDCSAVGQNALLGLERCTSGAGGDSPINDTEGYQSSVEYVSPASPVEMKPDISFFVDTANIIRDQPILPFTSEEAFLVENIINTEVATTQSIPVNPEVLMDMIEAAKSGKVIPYSALVEGYTTCMRRIIQFVSKLDFFQSFVLPDQRNLLLHNTDMIVNLRSARLLRPGINLQAQINHATGGPSLENTSTSMDLFKCPERLEYKQIFQSPWACDEKHEAQFASLMENLFHLEMDRTTTTLMAMIVLFSTSYAELKDSHRAVQNQEFFTQLLYRYLGSVIGRKNAIKLLPKYMHLISQLEEMSQIMITKRLTI